METVAKVNIVVNGKEAEETLTNLRKTLSLLTKGFIDAEKAGNKILAERKLSEINTLLSKIEDCEGNFASIENSLNEVATGFNDESNFSRLLSAFKNFFSKDVATDLTEDFINSVSRHLDNGGFFKDLSDGFLKNVDLSILDNQLGSFLGYIERLDILLTEGMDVLSNGYSPSLIRINNDLRETFKLIKGLESQIPSFLFYDLSSLFNSRISDFNKKLSITVSNFRSQKGTENQQLQSELNAENVRYYNSLDDLLKRVDKTAVTGYERQIEKLKLLEEHLRNILALYEAYGRDDSSQWANANLRLTQTLMKERDVSFKHSKSQLDLSYSSSLLDNDYSLKNGNKSYEIFLSDRFRLSEDYYARLISLFETYGKTETIGYRRLLERKQNMYERYERDVLSLQKIGLQEEKESEQQSIFELYQTRGNLLYRNERMLRSSLLDLDISYLNRELGIEREGTASWLRTKQNLFSKSRSEEFNKIKLYNEKLIEWRKANLIDGSDDLLQIELGLLDEMHEKEIVSLEEFEKIRAELIKRYRSEGISFKYETDFKDNGIGDQLRALSESFEELINNSHSFEDVIEHIGEVSKNAFSIATMYLGAFSQYFKAEQDLEVAQVESSYDKKIKAAGSNQRKVKRLEAKKQSEIAKIKTKYNKREQKIEIAQAIASTALAAINAYASASKVNWLLGAIAAAMAIAFGSIQIATIQKQHQAEQVGYYHGGFTRRDPNNNREVGVVHANEFVVNHDAVSNPHLSPILRLIDEAQRNNTVGSLSSDDVSRAIGQGRYHGRLIAGQENVITHFDLGLSSLSSILQDQQRTLDDLRNSLSDGIEAYMIMDGENGFHHRYSHFKRLIENPKR